MVFEAFEVRDISIWSIFVYEIIMGKNALDKWNFSFRRKAVLKLYFDLVLKMNS